MAEAADLETVRPSPSKKVVTAVSASPAKTKMRKAVAEVRQATTKLFEGPASDEEACQSQIDLDSPRLEDLGLLRRRSPEVGQCAAQELSRQIATLIEKVQYLQPSIQGGDDLEDAQIQFENPFDTLKWSRFDYTWENNEFVDWLNTIEEVLQYYDIPSKKGKRKLNGKIKTWGKLKKKQFLPFDYMQTSYNDLFGLKQERKSLSNSGQQYQINSQFGKAFRGYSNTGSLPSVGESGYFGASKGPNEALFVEEVVLCHDDDAQHCYDDNVPTFDKTTSDEIGDASDEDEAIVLMALTTYLTPKQEGEEVIKEDG
ncbi:hypothetical protein Acr_00g0074880 [Actinidia rufa]|uniref:Uncharacterized protein n=1 Tax=Actinidia rufa TaxID=165716 RepID=A0A7J0DT22_9ERIC|nr:hypothetical protein Acr_00g0074880 [Actinidia rufa]